MPYNGDYGKEKGNPRGDYNPGGDETAARRQAIGNAMDGKGMLTCPHCGKKYSASNVGGAAVGGAG